MGSMLALRKDPHLVMTRFAREYGDVCLIRLGSVPTVIISHPGLLRDGFAGTDLSDRPLTRITEITTKGGKDIAFASYGEHWRQLQRFANRELLSFRRSQEIGERHVEGSVNSLAEQLGRMSDAGAAFEPGNLLPRTNAELMFRSLFGGGESDTEDFRNHVDDLMDIVFWLFANVTVAYLGDYIPALNFLPSRVLKEAQGIPDRFYGICDTLIDRVKERPERNPEDPGCLVEVMLASVEKGEISHETIKLLIMDLLNAGIDTTAQTISWLLLILANRPQIQDRVYEELDAAAGAGGLPGMEHQESLPYLHATILEIMRYRTVLPLGLPHKASQDVELDGCLIPEGAQVIGNIYAIHNDPRFWDSPGEFNPERFLFSEDGAPPPALAGGAFMPFGAGRRVCPGQSLAEIVIWRQAAGLLRQYRFTPRGASSLPEDEVFGVSLSPRPYALNVERRAERR